MIGGHEIGFSTSLLEKSITDVKADWNKHFNIMVNNCHDYVNAVIYDYVEHKHGQLYYMPAA